MAPEIRAYRDDDFSAVAALECGTGGSKYQAAVFIRQAAVLFNDQFLVLEQDRRAVGFTIGARVQGNGEEAWVLRLKVEEGLRGNGFGRQLLEALLGRFCESGASGAVLTVSPSNTPARRLYESAGFGVVGEEPGYFGDGEDRLVMRLPLR
ncbi:GNAT family N-acetyltransferase [Methanofollis fontis]|uniref:N-acetyltransferase n=1 Tax=Methanofollis fontis TaxID=2052832 RepID=A0A483CXB3_9EURY|nr:N-acetyltransferase [Methanofollis fontis]TAJ43863.1 N-acetyltransferase [Methanofollis fontis]